MKALINGDLALGAQMNVEIVSNIHFLFVQLQCEETLQKLECNIDGCNKSFTMKQNLEIHKNIKHVWSEAFKCSLCEASFCYKSALNKHVKGVHPKSNIKCYDKKCGATFFNARKRSAHIKTGGREGDEFIL